MADIKVSEIKKYLKSKEHDELANEILQLIKLYPEVKQYYRVLLDPEAEKDILEKYRKIIENEFYPDRGSAKVRYAVVKQAIRDFAKISKSPDNVADLMLYYAELGVKFTNDYGDIGARFYDAIVTAYDKALAYIFANDLEEQFHERAKALLENIRPIGWGFRENMKDYYYFYY